MLRRDNAFPHVSRKHGGNIKLSAEGVFSPYWPGRLPLLSLLNRISSKREVRFIDWLSVRVRVLQRLASPKLRPER